MLQVQLVERQLPGIVAVVGIMAAVLFTLWLGGSLDGASL
jgi:hypothetical protein